MLPIGIGNPSSPILIVGEAFGENEERTGQPFSGASGMELNKMLNEAGLMRSDCWVTNVVNARPPRNNLDHWIPPSKTGVRSHFVPFRGRFVDPIVAEGYASLLKEIELVKPKIIITLGNTSLWALTGRSGITKWRGSLLEFQGIRLVPTYHPAAILRMWEWRAIAILDLIRSKQELSSLTPTPAYRFIIKPTFQRVIHILKTLLAWCEFEETWLDFDLETVAGHIRCAGISWSKLDSLCIPFMTTEDWSGYWNVAEEGEILWWLYKVLTHPNARLRGQNLLYDFQYTHKRWHFVPTLGQDTMISHHTLWAGMPKSLLFQASMYCQAFWNWKDMVRHDSNEKEGA